MKTYVLIVNRFFPKKHKKSGEPTFFVENILSAFKNKNLCEILCSSPDCEMCTEYVFYEKIHTIRSNYDLWGKRIKEIQEGKAVLSLRYWSDRPYRKDANGIGQVEFLTLDKDSGIGIQKIKFYDETFKTNWVVGQFEYPDQLLSSIAENDGLKLSDFKNWFKGSNLNEPFAIIHFTNFRY